MKPDIRSILVNLIFFQVVWLITVYGPGAGIPWLGLPAIIIFASYHFFNSASARADFFLVATAILLGFFVETGYVKSGILVYAFNIPSPHFAPYWILVLWANFALTLNTGLRWLQGRHFAAALLGFIGAPLAYFSGVKLGSAAIGPAPAIAYFSIGLSWAVITPALLFLARSANRRLIN